METEERAVGHCPSELPIWARLAFAKMIPEVYFWDEERTKPRKPQDARVDGFIRTGDMIEIYYTMRWPDPNAPMVLYKNDIVMIEHLYCWPVMKT